MPFDDTTKRESETAEALRVLRMAREGVLEGWCPGHLVHPDEEKHCLIGWLAVATGELYGTTCHVSQDPWDIDGLPEACRVASTYLYPLLPLQYQMQVRLMTDTDEMVFRANVCMSFNDDQIYADHVVDLLDDAIEAMQDAI